MIDLSKFKLHIFDLDDTLVNTKEAYWFAQVEAVRDCFPEISEQHLTQLTPRLKWLCHIFGSSKVRNYFEAFLKSEPESFVYNSKELDAIVLRYNAHFKSGFTCFEGAKEYLNSLVSSGKTLAIASNGGFKSQLSKLERTGCLDFFPKRLIFISGEYAKELEKPSPYMLEKACLEAEIEPVQTVFYGNSDVDILAGNLAGVKTAHFNRSTALSKDFPQFAAPHFTFQNWTALLKS